MLNYCEAVNFNQMYISISIYTRYISCVVLRSTCLDENEPEFDWWQSTQRML